MAIFISCENLCHPGKLDAVRNGNLNLILPTVFLQSLRKLGLIQINKLNHGSHREIFTYHLTAPA
jgi:hypothetical protein